MAQERFESARQAGSRALARLAPAQWGLVGVLLFGALHGAPRAELPAFSIKDCLGRPFTDEHFRKNGAVVVITAPTHAQGDAQNAWNRALSPLDWPEGGPVYAFLQDFSQSWFQAIAMAQMKKRYDPPPLLLVDQDGSVRSALGFLPSMTVLAIYAPGGRLLSTETNGATEERAKEAWKLARMAFQESRSRSNAAGPRSRGVAAP